MNAELALEQIQAILQANKPVPVEKVKRKKTRAQQRREDIDRIKASYFK